MKLTQYLVERLVEYKVTDVFGIPGGVILDFIYELDKHEQISVHLSFHEQAAAYAACGYAQSSGKLGVAYATKGPGVTNMFTAIAEAYYDSLPVLFITAHSQNLLDHKLRIQNEQEIDHSMLVAPITKYSKRVDTVEDAIRAIKIGCREAMSGRKGPVLLDFSNKIFPCEIEPPFKDTSFERLNKNEKVVHECITDIIKALERSKRPIFLIGDGVRLSKTERDIASIAARLHIPILSSRFSQDVVSKCKQYFGYIGSHGLRYSNFILSKTDCIISLGNRLAFRTDSASFKAITDKAQIIRVDIDCSEFNRKIPNSSEYCIDLKTFVKEFNQIELLHKNNEWINICHILKEKLENCDINFGVEALAAFINMLQEEETIVCDIGNNELLASRAYAISGNGKKLLHSKAFKTVGSAIGKAIGAYYANQKRVLCIVGDQGFQFNIQELQYVKANRLPIIFVVCNNNASEMLKDAELRQGYEYNLHTTINSGYSHPNFQKIANAYGINYLAIRDLDIVKNEIFEDEPQIIELFLDSRCEIHQCLPKGYPCQMFVPEIDKEMYDYLNDL